MKRLLRIVLLACVLSSCVHRTFEYDGGRIGYVEVVFDWRHDPAADPGSMSLYLFPRGGGAPERYEFSGREGGVIRVVPGLYDAVCINSDCRDVFYRSPEWFDTFEVTTPELGTMTLGPAYSCRASDLPGTEGTKVMMQPPMMWSSSETGFNVTVNSKYTNRDTRSKITIERQVLTMYPRPIVDTYVVTVKNVRNAHYLHSLSGTISDMSDGYLAGLQRDTDTSVILSFNLMHDVGAANAEGMFLTFGHCPAARRGHKLILYAILIDGSKYYYEFDVSDQAHNPPDEKGIYHIVVEFLDVPEPTGLAPTVGEWNSMDIYPEM